MNKDNYNDQDRKISRLLKEELDQVSTPEEWKEELLAKARALDSEKAQQGPAKSQKGRRQIIRFLATAASLGLILGGSIAMKNTIGKETSAPSDKPPVNQSGNSANYGAEGTPSTDGQLSSAPYSCRLKDLGPDGASGGAGYSSELHKYDGDNCAECQGLTVYPEEYEVKALRFEDESALATGNYYRYSYEHFLKEGELNECFERLYPGFHLTSTGMCAPKTVEAGYDNYSADAGQISGKEEGYTTDLTYILVSENAFTGKFSFNASYSDDYLLSLPENYATYDLDELDEFLKGKAAEFAANFEEITGKLEYLGRDDFEMGFPINLKEAPSDELSYVELTGRTYYFSSEYGKESLEAMAGLSLPSASINSMPDGELYNVFSVTLFPDGKIFSADNTITRAKSQVTGEVDAADKEELQKLTRYLTAPVKDDTLVVKKVSIPSYNNYFGNVEIEPLMRVEYYFESDPTDIRTTDYILYGFKYNL